MSEPTNPAENPTDADPVPAPPLEENPSATGLVVGEDELDED